MKGLLFLADPNSIHDIKWMRYFADQYRCYLVARHLHLQHWSEAKKADFFRRYKIRIVGAVPDFSVRRFYANTRHWKLIAGFIQAHDIAIFHIMYAEPNALWALYRARTPHVRWILTTRGSDVLKTIPAHLRRRDLLNRIVGYCYRKAFSGFDRITCTSGEQAARIRMLGQNLSSTIIRTGVDVERIMDAPTNSLPQTLVGKRYVLFPRNMRPLYNHEFSIQAIAALPLAFKQQYHFVFVDSDSKDAGYVSSIRHMMALDGDAQFVFLERQSQEALWALYKNAALVVMNPVSDGAPVSAMEAMVCSVPLILGNLPYDQDLFGGTVLRLTTWNPEELTQRIQEVLEGRHGLDLETAKMRVLELGNREVEMNRLGLLYQSVLQEMALKHEGDMGVNMLKAQ